MKKWFNRFWTDHGTRLVFMGLAATLATVFIGSGVEKMVSAGEVILIGIAMLLYNKARSSPKPDNEASFDYAQKDVGFLQRGTRRH